MLGFVSTFVQVSIIFQDLVYVMKYKTVVRVILLCLHIADVEQLSSVKNTVCIL